MDYDTCDEVLETIASRFGEDIYRNAVVDYHKMLTNIKTAENSMLQANEDSNQFVKTPNSIYPIHRKLGRPAHDLVRDESGEYHLKSTYYARQNAQAEGVIFNTAKILVGGDE
jgi:hypothetical protein